MNIIVCLDDNNGMMFNSRRQSSDVVLTRHVIDLARESKLWMNEYSAPLFDGFSVCVSDDFLTHAKSGEYCFVENSDIAAHMDRVETLIIYRWNRHYPSDRTFDVSLDGWRLVESKEFAGKSHPIITWEVYER